MASTIMVRALQRVSFSEDGFTIVAKQQGDEFELPSHLYADLRDEKKVIAFDEAGVIDHGGEDDPSADPNAGQDDAAQVAATASAAAAATLGEEDLEKIHHVKLISMARQVDPNVKTRAEALVVLKAQKAG